MSVNTNNILNIVNDLLTKYVSEAIDAENKLFYLNPSSAGYSQTKRSRDDCLSKKEVLEELLSELVNCEVSEEVSEANV